MRGFLVVSLLVLGAGRTVAAPLTVDEAVKLALQHNTQIVQSDASLLTAKSGMWSAYSGVLPSVSGSWSRSGAFTGEQSGLQQVGTGFTFASAYDIQSYTSQYGLSGSWNLLNLSSWSNYSAAKAGLSSAQYSQSATRQNVVLNAKTQFYQVVQAMHLSRVNAQALKLARDSERRVNAMYEVGSVSKSDLLQAQVNTSQAQLDSLTAADNVTTQRILLAQQLGLSVAQLAEVDSTLVYAPVDVNEAQVLSDAQSARPDVKAANSDAHSAELSLRAARWARLPYLGLSGTWKPDTKSNQASTTNSDGTNLRSTSSESKRAFTGAVGVSVPIFDGLVTDSRVASARARVLTSHETRDALLRNLEGQVHQAVVAYQEAVQRISLAETSVASAAENQNLVQQKYNVGSATILDLINSQVQLQRAQSTYVSAMAAMQVAKAQIDQVRGRP